MARATPDSREPGVNHVVEEEQLQCISRMHELLVCETKEVGLESPSINRVVSLLLERGRNNWGAGDVAPKSHGNTDTPVLQVLIAIVSRFPISRSQAVRLSDWTWRMFICSPNWNARSFALASCSCAMFRVLAPSDRDVYISRLTAFIATSTTTLQCLTWLTNATGAALTCEPETLSSSSIQCINKVLIKLATSQVAPYTRGSCKLVTSILTTSIAFLDAFPQFDSRSAVFRSTDKLSHSILYEFDSSGSVTRRCAEAARRFRRHFS